MQFLNPQFLWALGLVAIPIIIHLFYFRRLKRVEFTNVRFLEQIKEETSTRNNLKRYLILISRILAIAALVLAFCKPFFPAEENLESTSPPKKVGVYVDNSFSMEAVGQQNSLLEQAKLLAADIVDAYGPETEYVLLTNDFQTKHQQAVNGNIFKEYVSELDISPKFRTLNDIQASFKLSFDGVEEPHFFLLSDFKKNMLVFDPDTIGKFFLLPISAGAPRNLSVDSAWLNDPVSLVNQTNSVIVRLSNRGTSDLENVNIQLAVNNQKKGFADVNIPAGSTVEDTLVFTISDTGWNNASISVSDYPVNFDDNYYFSFDVKVNINILVITEKRSSPFRGFSGLSPFEFTVKQKSEVDYSTFSRYDLLILDQLEDISSGLSSEINTFVRNGGSLSVFPSLSSNLSAYNLLFKELNIGGYSSLNPQKIAVSKSEIEDGLLKDVFVKLPGNVNLPVAQAYYNLSSKRGIQIKYLNGDPFLIKREVGNGLAYVFTTGPDVKMSDLASHSLFALTILKIAVDGKHALKPSFFIGMDNKIAIPNLQPKKDQVYALRNGKNEFIPQQQNLGRNLILNFQDEIYQAGHYALEVKTGKPLLFLSWNYNREESDLSDGGNILNGLATLKNIEVLEGVDTNISATLSNLAEGRQLWRFFLILALIFFAIETLLIRFLPN